MYFSLQHITVLILLVIQKKTFRLIILFKPFGPFFKLTHELKYEQEQFLI